MRLACDLLLFFVAIAVPMAGIAWAVVRLGTPQAARPLCLRPKLGAVVRRGGWVCRLLRVLLLLALAAACAWLMTGCSKPVAEGGAAALPGIDRGFFQTWTGHVALVVFGFTGLCGLLLMLYASWLPGGRVRPSKVLPPPPVPASTRLGRGVWNEPPAPALEMLPFVVFEEVLGESADELLWPQALPFVDREDGARIAGGAAADCGWIRLHLTAALAGDESRLVEAVGAAERLQRTLLNLSLGLRAEEPVATITTAGGLPDPWTEPRGGSAS